MYNFCNVLYSRKFLSYRYLYHLLDYLFDIISATLNLLTVQFYWDLIHYGYNWIYAERIIFLSFNTLNYISFFLQYYIFYFIRSYNTIFSSIESY